MVLGRLLTAQERRRSQRLYCAFCFVNGMSYMCLGESLLVLFAAQLGAPDAVVALLGAMQYIGYAMLPLGVRRTARRGAAVSQADFWVARNVAALVTASAGPVWLVSPPAAWALLLLGALLFYGFRAAGCVLFTPLLGDVSTEEEAPSVIGVTTAFFNASAVVTLAAITVATHRWHGRQALVAVIVVGSVFGLFSSVFLRGMRETGAIRDAARAPLWRGMLQALRNSGLRRLVGAWFFLNLGLIMLVPISMLALKRGCGFDDGKALVCACAQFAGGVVSSFACGPLCRRFGARSVLVAAALGCVAVPLAWLAFPSPMQESAAVPVASPSFPESAPESAPVPGASPSFPESAPESAAVPGASPSFPESAPESAAVPVASPSFPESAPESASVPGASPSFPESAPESAAGAVASLSFQKSAGATDATLFAGLVLFFFIGALYYLIYNATSAAFLVACPDKKDQVSGSIAANLLAGAGSGVAGSALGAWLVSRAVDWSVALPCAVFLGPLGYFRLYFLLVVPVALAALAATLRMRFGHVIV